MYLFYRHKSRQTTSTYQVAGTWYVVLVLCKTYPVECYTTIVLMDAVFLHQVQYLYLYNWKDVGDDMRWHGVRVCRCHAPLSHCLTFHNTTNHILPPNSITTWYVQVFILGCSSVHFILCWSLCGCCGTNLWIFMMCMSILTRSPCSVYRRNDWALECSSCHSRDRSASAGTVLVVFPLNMLNILTFQWGTWKYMVLS